MAGGPTRRPAARLARRARAAGRALGPLLQLALGAAIGLTLGLALTGRAAGAQPGVQGGPQDSPAAPPPAVPPALTAALAPATRALPASSLAVRGGGAWRGWWRSEHAPARWDAAGVAAAGVAAGVRWRATAPGVDVGELALAGTGEARRVRVVLVRLDPRRTRLALHAALDAAGRAGPWRVDRAPAAALAAVNAGQFGDAGPWGWVVHEGAEWRPPGRGALAPAVVVDAAGRVRLVPPDSIAAMRAALGTAGADGRGAVGRDDRGRDGRGRDGRVREAFQSYPALLVGDGEVPAELRAPGRGVDLAHRDARLALGVLPDGRVLLALTRFGAFSEELGDALGAVPFGPTVPEMAALLGALGARRAVLLDGGISGQLLVRGGRGAPARAWRGLRPVALGLVALPR